MGRFTSFVIFAEMRTGSNFLEANINQLPGVHSYGEAFNPYLIGGEGNDGLFGFSLAARDADPASFLRSMRAHTKGLAGFRFFSDHDARVFDLVVDDPACAKIILTRNQLESYISWKIATESDQWWLADTKHLQTVRPRFDLAEFQARLDATQAFQRKLVHRLQISGQTAFYIDYDDVLDLEVLNGLATFLGVEARLPKLNFDFKKQNPEAVADKVLNPKEMQAGLARVDWFSIHHTPNFEPRRQAAVPQYVASEGAPLLFMPLKSGPEARLRKWLQSYGALLPGFDRQSLRKWKVAHPGLRSFAVLRHPLARAYAAYCDYLEKDWMPELRLQLAEVHKFILPPKGQGFASADEFRAGFKVFLELSRHMLNGRTGLKMPPQIATQGALLQGFGQLQAPDHLLREDRLAEGLGFLAAETGIAANPLPREPESPPYALADLYGPDLEAFGFEAYWRDYEAFGFQEWRR